MPKRDDISSILIIGAGPIIIGQACEFDYSGTQAVKALKDDGYRVILVNSNPATIMTDPGMADATYVEPITPAFVEKIIAKERPDALLPTMGGQTALNTALTLAQSGVLEKYSVELIGANKDAIDKAEDRLLFREAMEKIGLECAKSVILNAQDHIDISASDLQKMGEVDRKKLLKNVAMTHAEAALDVVGLPTIIRPSYTLGGTGGGIAYNKQDFLEIVESGLDASPTTEVLIEESIVGWKEYEMEVVRDKADNCIIICSIENVDPMGVHTGDSITVAPALTLTDKEYQIMRNASIAVLREIGVETGGSNVQFAVNPADGRLIVIEMNPRVSRSSALASKATGFPIAKVAAKLAVGYTLDEIDNDITGVTPASFEPTIDYVVTKIPRFTFEKFKGTKPLLTSAMKSVGEAMAIGRSWQESVQKALRSLETGLCGFDEQEIDGVDPEDPDLDLVRAELAKPTPTRMLMIAQAFRYGLSYDDIRSITKFEPWFVRQIEEIVAAEAAIKAHGLPQTRIGMQRAKSMGFSDQRLADLLGLTEAQVTEARMALNVTPSFKRIDTCAAEFEAKTPYLYSTYEYALDGPAEDEARVSDARKIAILGGGPNRIGQGIEFDYCCCHACFALSDAGFETIMINCNPETVSTDYDTSDRLYFEPLTAEDVIAILRKEQQAGELVGVIVQLGGQTPLKLAQALQDADIPILGTSPDAIDLAEDRERFQKLLASLQLKQPRNATARSAEEARAMADQVGYPVLIRPSYVLGGRGMEIVDNPEQLGRYIHEATQVSGDSPVLIDAYLRGAIEVDVDAICDGEKVHVAGILEHIEEAGIHSGDSACCLPPHSLPPAIIEDIERQTVSLAKALEVRGLMNVQYAIKNGVVYLIEVNPRASRTVPFVAKAKGTPYAKIAARVMAGEALSDFELPTKPITHLAVKEAVFPFTRFPGVDVILGPEMRSTGEVMGIDSGFEAAFAKSQIAAGNQLPEAGRVFISVKDPDKAAMVGPAQSLLALGFSIVATGGTADYLAKHGVDVENINKVAQGSPHIVDEMINGTVQLVFNTTAGDVSLRDSKPIRQTALFNKIPYFTTTAGALAATEALKAIKKDELGVRSLQEFFSDD
ncbi:MAG: carbamoyl-phosphate synthase large subunit [Pseudomonadota bacterium]